MEAMKRLELEMQKHRATINDIQKSIKHDKCELKRVLDNIDLDVEGENDALNYGLVYENSNRICKRIKELKELQQLIILKSEIYLKHTKS